MIRTIDKSNTHIIQKIISPKGERIGYQVAPILEGKPYLGDSELITRCSSLAEARSAAGWSNQTKN